MRCSYTLKQVTQTNVFLKKGRWNNPEPVLLVYKHCMYTNCPSKAFSRRCLRMVRYKVKVIFLTNMPNNSIISRISWYLWLDLVHRVKIIETAVKYSITMSHITLKNSRKSVCRWSFIPSSRDEFTKLGEETQKLIPNTSCGIITVPKVSSSLSKFLLSSQSDLSRDTCTYQHPLNLEDTKHGQFQQIYTGKSHGGAVKIRGWTRIHVRMNV